MQLFRTEQIHLPPDDILSRLCRLSKNLWNEANYIVRQGFFNCGKWIRYSTLAGTLRSSGNFRELPAATAQQVLRILDRSWGGFFRAVKEWQKRPEKFVGRPKLPGYRKKDGEFLLAFTNQQVSVRGGYVTFPKKLGLRIETRLKDDTDIREARIVPKGTGYVLEIVYEKKQEPLNLDKNRIVGIDLGLRNIVTMANNIGEKPIVIKGSALKSMNQYYNKRLSRLLSIYDNQGIKTGQALKKLTEKRNRKIRDAMHKISRYIVNWCVDHGVGTIVIGYNSGWKRNVRLGRRNNQQFVTIPHYILARHISYKSEDIGIEVIQQDEAHTSKCSFLDNEPVEHHNTYAGTRISRGLFRSARGILINADVNGGLNIIIKAIPNAFADGIEGAGHHPESLTFKGIVGQGLLIINHVNYVTKP